MRVQVISSSHFDFSHADIDAHAPGHIALDTSPRSSASNARSALLPTPSPPPQQQHMYAQPNASAQVKQNTT